MGVMWGVGTWLWCLVWLVGYEDLLVVRGGIVMVIGVWEYCGGDCGVVSEIWRHCGSDWGVVSEVWRPCGGD